MDIICTQSHHISPKNDISKISNYYNFCFFVLLHWLSSPVQYWIEIRILNISVLLLTLGEKEFTISPLSHRYSWRLSGKRIHPQCRRPESSPWVGKILWRREWLPTPIFLPGESPWTEEAGGLHSIGLQRVRHDWETNSFTFPPQKKIKSLKLGKRNC